jgi:hypothetical protein
VSRVRLLWGRIRATLSPGHQRQGSNFDVETPNALIGVKFSVPIVEVTYDPAIPRTIAFGDGIDILVTDLVTGVFQLVPANSTAVVDGMGIRVFPGRIDPGNIDAPTRSGISPTVWGIGLVAAAGGIALLAEDSESSNSESDTPDCSNIAGSWSGRFEEDYCNGISDIAGRRSGSWSGTIFSNCSMEAYRFNGLFWFEGTISGNILIAAGKDTECGSFVVNGEINGNNINGNYTYSPSGVGGEFSGNR